MRIDYVAGFMFTPKRNRVLLIEKARPAWQAGKLNGIGGKVEQCEPPLCAMIREFKEEVGIETNYPDWHFLCSLSQAPRWSVSFYCCFSDKAFHYKQLTDEKPHLILVENLNLHARLDGSPIPPLPNLRWLIPLALDEGVQKPLTFQDIGTV